MNTKNACTLHTDKNLALRQDSTPATWEFFCDSGFGGNHKVQNKRRDQNGYVTTENDAPMDWASKVSSVAFAHPDVGEAHADTSSGAAEICLAANATCSILALSHSADEMGISFPSLVNLQMCNSTAAVFVNDTAHKTKLKHIDVRQQWVQTLRDKNILRLVHVDTKDNATDLFTKILGKQDFTRLRAMVVKPKVTSI